MASLPILKKKKTLTKWKKELDYDIIHLWIRNNMIKIII